VLQLALADVAQAGVDFSQPVGQVGYYEIDLRVLGAEDTLKTARAAFTHYAVLRDRTGRMHLFQAGWPGEIGE
jgi:hypothetical protein